jgi:hypothetical protein
LGGHILAVKLPGYESHATVGKHFGDVAMSEVRVWTVPRRRILTGICFTPEEKLWEKFSQSSNI